MATNTTDTQETIDSTSNDDIKRLHLPLRETISIAETVDVSNADLETKEDLQKIATEYEKSFRKRAERILDES